MTPRLPYKLVGLLVILVLLHVLVGSVLAKTTVILYEIGPLQGQPTGVEFTTPDHYGSCTATSDTITTTGVGDRQLIGGVAVQYVTPTGRQLVRTYTVNQVGNLNLTIEYPPVSEWPVTSTGPSMQTQELHVDISIGLYEQGVRVATLGPGNDWDVFCLTPVQTSTSTPTRTATNTPTNTATSTGTATPTNTASPTSTNTSTPYQAPWG